MVLECLGYNVYSEACKQGVALWLIGFVVVIIGIILGWLMEKRFGNKKEGD